MKLFSFNSRSLRRNFVLMLTTVLFASVLIHAEDRHVQKRVSPVYPELAKRMHLSGAVRLSATVASDGSVTEVKVVSGNSVLTTAAQEALRKWVYAQADATTTEMVEINFEPTN